MATFYPFSRLPAELRLRIWEMTVEPRVVDVHYRRTFTPSAVLRVLSSSTPVPATLQTCRESRNAGLYQRCFSDLAILSGSPEDSERRYVWLNLDIDVVSVGDSELEIFRPVAHKIKRLRFVVDNNCEWWANGNGHKELHNYINASEIQIVLCKDGYMRDWHGASDDYYWPCGKENVLIMDLKKGEEMKLMDLEFKFDRIAEEESRKQGYNYLYQNGEIIN